MEYTYLNQEEQIAGLANRIHQLEQEHFTNTLLIEECNIVGDDKSKPEFERIVMSLEPRIKALKARLEDLEKNESSSE